MLGHRRADGRCAGDRALRGRRVDSVAAVRLDSVGRCNEEPRVVRQGHDGRTDRGETAARSAERRECADGTVIQVHGDGGGSRIP